MKSFLSVFDELSVALDSVHLNEYPLTDNDLLEEICSFLKVFDEVIEQLSDDRRPTIFKVLPLRQRLLNECEVETGDNQGRKEVKQFLDEFSISSWGRFSFFADEQKQ